MRRTFVDMLKFFINQIVIVVFILTTIVPAAGIAQSTNPASAQAVAPTPAAVMTPDTTGGYESSDKYRNLKKEEAEGYKLGVIEIITTIVFGLVLTATPFPKRFDPSKNDCPLNVFGLITVAIAKAAAITYIITEIWNHYEFKQVGEAIQQIQTVDQAQATAGEILSANCGAGVYSKDKEKDKQIQSFCKLAGLYDNEKKLLENKLKAQGVMTAMFATALGVELGGIIACKATCGITHGKAVAIAGANLTTMATTLTTAVTTACAGPQAVALCGTCTSAGINGGRILGSEAAWLASVTAKGAATVAKKQAKYAKDSGDLAKSLADLMTATTAGKAKVEELGQAMPAETEDTTTAAKNSGETKTAEANRDQASTDFQSAVSSCTTASAIPALFQAYVQALKNDQVLCCGTELKEGKPNLLTAGLPTPTGLAYVNRDLKEPKDTKGLMKKFLDKMKGLFSKIGGAAGAAGGAAGAAGEAVGTGAGAAPTTSIKPFIRETDEYGLYAQADFFVQLEQRLDNDRKKGKKLTMKDHWEMQKFIEHFYSKENLKKYDPILIKARKDKDPFVKKLVSMLDLLLVPTAQAKGFGDILSSPVLQVMMFSTPLTMMFKDLIAKYYDKWFQKAPINRTVLWGVLTALAATVTSKTKKMQDDIATRKQTVLDEMQQFIKQTTLTNQTDENKSTTGNAGNSYGTATPSKSNKSKNDSNKGFSSCFTEEGADPACGCKAQGSCMNFPDQDIGSLNLPSIYTENMKASNKMANSYGKGDFAGARVAGAHFGADGLGSFGALKRKNKELMNKINEIEKANKQPVTDFEGQIDAMGKAITAAVNGTIGKESGANMGPLSSTGPSGSLDKNDKSGVNAYVPPTYNGPAAPTGSNAAAGGSLLDDAGLLTEELPADSPMGADEQATALGKFELENNDITKKSEESLFKILSSRYLRTAYPKLLKLETAPAPAAKKPDTPAEAPK